MGRPSAPLLSWLRDMLKQKGLNTAHVADASGIPRARIRRILDGTEDMTVDELMLLSDSLQLDPADLSSQAIAQAEAKADAPVIEPEDTLGVDPWGNQPEQLFRIAFGLGCDFFFLADTTQLEGSGVPETVLKQYNGRELPIKLDAAYHKYNDPKYGPDGITLTLSFDQLYDCTFRWPAIKQFVLFPLAPEPPSDTDEAPGADEDEQGAAGASA